MKLYISPTSPYVRIVRALMVEKGIADRVEIIVARTRTAGSEYYQINPSGRVPYLALDDGRAFESTPLICDWLDNLDGAPRFAPPPGDDAWEYRRLEGLGHALLDGVSVWVRELHRPEGERSPTIIAHEKARAERLTAAWEKEVGHPLMNGPLNIPQMVLATGLQIEARIPDFEWRERCPELSAWLDRVAVIPSMAETQVVR